MPSLPRVLTGWLHFSEGNLLLLNEALAKHETFFIRCGIFLILEKLKIITYRNLFKKVWVIIEHSAFCWLPLELQPEDYPENAPTAPAQAGLRAGREVWYKEKIKHPRKCQNKCPVFRAIVFNCSKGFLMKLKGRRSYKSHLTIILDKDEEILSVGAVPRKP